MKYPFILILQEKHGNSYYLMDNANDVTSFALKTLNERYKAGYYYIKPKPLAPTFEEFFESIHIMTLAAAEELAVQFNDTVKIGNRTPKNEIKSTRNAYIHARAETEEYAAIEKAVKEQNAKLAWQIIYNRSCEGYQYESISMEQIENREAH